MEIYVVNPHGYCAGVQRAMEVALQAKKDYPNRHVFLLGLLVHNEIATQELEDSGLVVLDEKIKDLSTFLSERKAGDVVVFSAHGHPQNYDEKAKELGLITIDATCPFVTENLHAGFPAERRPLFYLGAKGHLEAEAFLANSPYANFIDAKNPEVHSQGDRCYLIAQTTLSDEEVEKGLLVLRQHYSDIHLLRSRCDATKLRQKAIRSLPKDVDMLIVLGSTRSNNSRKLAEIGQSLGIETHLCLGLDELKAISFQGKQKVAIASGASTPRGVFESCKAYLCELSGATSSAQKPR